MLPGIVLTVAAVILFYIGFVNFRGLEGAAFGIIDFILTIFSIISFSIGKKDTTNQQSGI
ncbi:hypothetical protein [Mesobacillus foraminis]|uniref:hypothetical protein n=1 Tax=Mesobacillus foraminis TaxID=279826 RepID=UPI001046B1DB|nr:hypothetical protein [Mesobacillus foraminis]